MDPLYAVKLRHLVFAVYVDKKQLAAYAVIAFAIGSILGGGMWNFGGVYKPEPPTSAIKGFGSLKRFSSYDALKNFLKSRSEITVTGRGFSNTLESEVSEIMGTSSAAKAAADAAKATADAAISAEIAGHDFSGTNIQVEGVDEADLVKTDGRYIYLARDDTLIIVRAYPPEEAEVVYRLHLYHKIRDLFVSGDKLVVFLALSEDVYRDLTVFEPPPNFKPTTIIQVYDISDRASPELERRVTVEGDYFNSRMIGDYAYAIVRKRAYVSDGEVTLPTIRSGRQWWKVKAEEIYYANYSDTRFYFTHILAINTQDPEEDVSSETFLLGRTSNLYVSYGNIYITAGSWEEQTTIYKIMIEEGTITYVADGSVPGWVLNQFSMDEHEGYFRIATTGWRASKNGGSITNNVYILNASLGIVGKLEGLAPGEEIYSARFMGDRCYLVTFEVMDPLFVIDLADPTNPKVLGKLKIPGYSNYLHPYDEGLLIGLGKETVEDGGSAWEQGVKISLFDVSEVSRPRELAKFVVGDQGTDSPALEDHKAFLFSRERSLLVIPILVSEYVVRHGKTGHYAYQRYVFQGAHVFDVSPEGGILLRGRVTHIDMWSGDDEIYQHHSAYEVERSLYIGDVLYTISDRIIKMNSLTDLAELGSVDLS